MDKLIVNDLHLSYGANPILQGVSFELNAGEVVCLLGASGSGKTTLLRAVAGLETPSSGHIRLDGRTFFDGAGRIDLPVEARSLGLVFQSYALWPHRTVAENVGYGLKLRRVASNEIKRRVQTALEQLGLGHLAARYPHQLSGGQQQRVAIARALVYNPPVILLDEPLSNLDAKLREEARAWLRELIVSLGLSALCVTHDQAEAMAMSDRILLLRDGRIEQEGAPAELYGAPRTLYTAEFMGSNNRLDARVDTIDGERVTLAGDGWRLAALARGALRRGEDAHAVIRVERVQVADGPGENRLPAELVTSMYLGDRWEYLFHCGALRLRAFGTVPRAAGGHWLEFPANDCWAFAKAG
ncbi:lipase [Burkholderia pseudomallei]|uniref:ABC transporter ATP-binding protein n=1 Tax=Burkholderia pseudomallei TaxID=28450 RepID=UPI0003D82B51|nr:ABC transporter ATP-binding protein [Burkholderia pseudomallei]AHE37347.1 ABC transporter family protein [Burkholderia pseudomallei NAU20B-16]AHG38192.1 ABC transporter family protein [Burkholderia pseudomallei MSHR511]AHG72083.1 ABC transporter family protein [Burkholderia pseudomallei MSHR146]OMX02451.1 lipase [Burkholderia pseudomallei]OMY07174.1 lipase [Burkholderia pseudomallei]